VALLGRKLDLAQLTDCWQAPQSEILMWVLSQGRYASKSRDTADWFNRRLVTVTNKARHHILGGVQDCHAQVLLLGRCPFASFLGYVGGNPSASRLGYGSRVLSAPQLDKQEVFRRAESRPKFIDSL
jgi:hypothetical protein